MKVTLNIPDEIHRQLKMKAAAEGTTMRALVLRAIALRIHPEKVVVQPHQGNS